MREQAAVDKLSAENSGKEEGYMNCRYTDDELKADVEKNIGIRAENIEKIQFCGLWHIRFRAGGTDFYY